MKNVIVEYPFLFFFRRRKEITVPDKWVDMSAHQYSIAATAVTSPMNDDEFISLFYLLKKSIVKKISRYEKFKLIECVEFILNPKAAVNFFYLRFIPGTELYAPEKQLKNIPFEQFMLFDTFFFDYINDSKDTDLHKFIGSLYLKKGEVLTSIDFQSRVKYISEHVDKATMEAILLNYTFVRKWLSSAFPFLFEYNEPDKEKKRRKPNPVKNNRPDWNSILDGFMGDDILREQEYRDIPCLRAFKTINKRIQKYKTRGRK